MIMKCHYCGYVNNFDHSDVDNEGDVACEGCGRELYVGKYGCAANSYGPAVGGAASGDLFYTRTDVTVSEEGELALVKGDRAYQLAGSKLNPIVSKREALIAQVPVSLGALKAGEVVLDPETQKPMFFLSATDSSLKLKDIANNNTFDRDVVESDITGAITVVKLLSINLLFRGNTALVVLAQRYGLNETAAVVAKQFVSAGGVDVKRVEFELNPVMAQIAVAEQLTALAGAVTASKA